MRKGHLAPNTAPIRVVQPCCHPWKLLQVSLVRVWGSLRASSPTPRRVEPQNNKTGKLQALFSMQDMPRHPSWQLGSSRNSPRWQQGQRGRHSQGSSAVPVTSEARGCHSGGALAVTAACHRRGAGCQRSAAVSPVTDTPEVAVTLRPAGFPLAGCPGTADPVKRGC